MSFGQRLKLMRKAHNFSQEYLAKKLDISINSISKWENGLTKPNGKNLYDLAQLLDTSIDFLLYGESQTANMTEEKKEAWLTANRLVEERGRLGVSQSELAENLAITLEELQSYEFQQEEIPASFLGKLARLGFDVNYILGGIRTPPARAELGNIYNVSQNDIQAVSVLGVDASGKE